MVGVADALDTPFLPNVDEEVRAIGADTTLVGPAATADRVLAVLVRHPWAHIACHGYHGVANPSRSYLAMYDRPLTAPEIAELDLPAAELAFLSACETAASGVLPDAAISTAAALQLAGYRHVMRHCGRSRTVRPWHRWYTRTALHRPTQRERCTTRFARRWPQTRTNRLRGRLTSTSARSGWECRPVQLQSTD